MNICNSLLDLEKFLVEVNFGNYFSNTDYQNGFCPENLWCD